MSLPEATLPQTVKGRFNNWKCYREGDLLQRLLKEGSLAKSVKQMLDIENEIVEGKKKPSTEKLPIKQIVVSGYKQLLDFALNKFSKKDN
jgi:hypothetical protein